MARTHGKRGTYNSGCRCDECRAANREYYHRPERKAAERERMRGYDREYGQRPERKAADRERKRDRRMERKLHVWHTTQVRPDEPMKHPYCEYCGHRTSVFMLTIDRVIPGCQGGEYTDGNMVLCCSMCNSHKAGLRPDEWTHPRYYEPGYTSPEIPF